jgi:putative transposase
MADYRRNLVQGGSYFFTVNLADRRSTLLVDRIEELRLVVRTVRLRRPFQIDAWVVLPDHMHCVWTLPEYDADYAGRWRAIKTGYTYALRRLGYCQPVWQARYWEHTIRDERDFAVHIDYVHLNPYKHGHVTRVRDWPYSSFHRFVRAGIYPVEWLADIDEISAGE